MEEFLGVNASYLAYQRLNNIKNERAELQPEIQLLNPQEGAKRLQPLEDAGWLVGCLVFRDILALINYLPSQFKVQEALP